MYGEDWDNIPTGDIGTGGLSTQVINDLQDKIPVGLSLEYKTPTNARITFNLSTDAGRVKFYDLYFRPEAGAKGFNQTVNASEVSNWSKVDVEVTPFLDATNFGDQTKFDMKNKIFVDFSETPGPLNGETLCVRGTLTDGSDFIATASDGSGTLKTAGDDTIATISGSKIDFSSHTSNFSTLTGISANYDTTDSTVASKIVIEHELLGDLSS